MEKNKVFIDFDGVILDSNDTIVSMKDERSDLSWDDFFEQLDWDKLYRESEEINDSFNIIRKLQTMRDNLYILTKIHSLVEAKSKVEVLRKNDIIIPMMIVPPHVRKSSIYVPDESCILVDDSKKNVVDWVENGGTGLLFDKTLEEDEKEKVKSLHFLLKG